MKKDDALQAILILWFQLPSAERETESQAVTFTFKVMNERPDLTSFKASGDKYQVIKGFLCRHLSRAARYPA
jgi:hypothetical protein